MSCVGYVDLLGFSDQVKINMDSASEVLNDFYNIGYELKKEYADLKLMMVSDSLFCWSELDSTVINFLCTLYRHCFEHTALYPKDSDKILIPRGAVAKGDVLTQQRTEAPQIKKNFMISPALVDAVKLEGKIKGARLLVGLKSGKEYKKVIWDPEIDTVLYNDSTISLVEGYEYCDALWFRITNRHGSPNKKKTLKFVHLAENLVERYSDKSRIIEHYIETLRIGLLSYSIFLEPTDMTFFSDLFSRFSDDKFWRIWFAIFEVALQSPERVKYLAQESFVGFLKKKALTKGWSQMTSCFRQKGNEHLYKLLSDFLNDLPISSII